MDNTKAPWLKFYGDVPAELDYPDVSMYELFRRAAEKYPRLTACEYMGAGITYSCLNRYVKRCAAALVSRGIGRGDRVTVCMPNCPQAVVMFYALNMTGAVANMIHPLSGENEIADYIEFSGSKAVLIPDMFYGKLQNTDKKISAGLIIVTGMADMLPLPMRAAYALTAGRKIKKPVFGGKVISWRKFMAGGEDILPPEDISGGEDVAAILYSGGTTGTTKGIMLTNMNFNACAMGTAALGDCIEAGKKLLAIMPVFHGFGLGVCVHTALISGGTSVLIPRFNSSEFVRLLGRKRPAYIVGVPTLFEALLRNEEAQKLDLSCLMGVFCGGDSLSPELKERVDAFLASHGSKEQIREGYGTTECVTAVCLTPRFSHRRGSIGVPFPDTLFRVVRPGTDETLPYGEEGEICVSGPTVMKGYLNKPEETAKALKTGSDGRVWLYTGDLGTMDSDGFVYFRQRLKRVIVTSGFNVYPSQVESVIDAHPSVSMSTVIGVRDDYRMQRVKAFIVPAEGVEPTPELEESIRAHCLKNMAKYAVPREFEFRTFLPKTLVGKVAYRELEKEEEEKFTGKQAQP